MSQCTILIKKKTQTPHPPPKKSKNHLSAATCPKLNCLKPSSSSALEDHLWRERGSIKLFLEPFMTKTRGCGKPLATVPINLASKHKLSGLNFHLAGTCPVYERVLMCV